MMNIHMNIHTINFRLYAPPPTYKHAHISLPPREQKSAPGYKPPPPPLEFEPPSSLYWNEFNFLLHFEAKKAIKFQKYSDQPCYVACFERKFWVFYF